MLVGRTRECRRIDALLSSARLGRSGVLVLTGEPGVGKTALLEYAAAHAEDVSVFSVTGTEPEHDLPFAGLTQLLRLTEEDLATLPAPQADALGVALALREGGTVDRLAVGAGLLGWLTHASEDRPVCLVIDDAHLLDGPSQDALAFATRRLLADAVAVLAAVRRDEPCRLLDVGAEELALTGLDAGATGELLATMASGPHEGPTAARVHALTGGNPLAIRSIAAVTDELRALPPDAPAPVSTAMGRVYGRRAEGLDDDARTAAEVASVAGEDLGTVARTCAQLGVPGDSLAAAEAAGVLEVSGGTVRFPHPLARSAVYASIPAGRRRMLHEAVSRCVPPGDVDRRAWHRSTATLGPDEVVAADLDRVAERGSARGGYRVAADAAERAAELSEQPDKQAERVLAAARWAWYSGETDRALRLLEQVPTLAPGSSMSARATRLRGVLAARCGAADEARDLLLAAGDAAETVRERIGCYAEAVSSAFYLGDAAGALEAARRIEAVLPEPDDVAGRIGRVAIGMARILSGLDGAVQIKEALREIWTPDTLSYGDPDDGAWLALGPLFVRDASTGRALIDGLVADRRSRSAISSLPHLLFHIARDGATTDRWSHAEADYGEAITIARELGQTTELAASLSGLAWLEARQGRSQATARAEEAIELATTHHLHVPRTWARFAVADLALGTGDAAEAAESYQQIEDHLHDLGVLDVDLSPVPELVEALLRLGRTDGLAEMAQRFSSRAAAKGQPWAMARAARALALLADDDEADRLFADALELHRSTLDSFEEARTLLLQGMRLRRGRQRVAARVPLERAQRTFTELGAEPWAATSADELAATGVKVVRHGSTPLSALTPRELQIAVPLAEGSTTRDVAARLFMSPKTVEYHLRHVYTKLDISSRAELAAALGRPGADQR